MGGKRGYVSWVRMDSNRREGTRNGLEKLWEVPKGCAHQARVECTRPLARARTSSSATSFHISPTASPSTALRGPPEPSRCQCPR